MEKLSSLERLDSFRQNILSGSAEKKRVVHVCMTGCRAYGSASVRDALEAEIRAKKLEKEVEIRSTGCHGFCAKAPVIAIEPQGIQYQEVEPDDAPEIVDRTLKKDEGLKRLAFHDPETGHPVFQRDEIPFYQKQTRRVLGKCGRIDPTRIEDYIAAGGYHPLYQVLSAMTPEEVIAEVQASKLRGRGGAGFPTGLKWKFAREAKNKPKYIICNADEGDPGAFMDRAILEGDPMPCLKACSSEPTPWARNMATSMSGKSTPLPWNT